MNGTLIKPPPALAPNILKDYDSTFGNNFIALDSYEFSFQYIYYDNEVTVPGTYSPASRLNFANDNLNRIIVTMDSFEQIPNTVRIVNLIARISDGKSEGGNIANVIKSWDKNVINEAKTKFNMFTQTEREVEEKLAQWYGKTYPTYQETNTSILRGLPLAIRRLYVGMREMYLNIRKRLINDSNYVNELFNTMESGIYRDFDVKEYSDDVIIDTALNNKGKRIKAYQSLYKVFSGDGTSNEINLEVVNLTLRRKLYDFQYGISKRPLKDLSAAVNKLREEKLADRDIVINGIKDRQKALYEKVYKVAPSEERLNENVNSFSGP